MFEQLIANAAKAHGLDPGIFLRQMSAESGAQHNPNAVSSAGARGVGQLMAGTARMLGVTDPSDPVQNINGAAAYDEKLLGQFGSYPKMLAAYNWGPGNLAHAGGNTAVAPTETQGYLTKILGAGGAPAASVPSVQAPPAPAASPGPAPVLAPAPTQPAAPTPPGLAPVSPDTDDEDTQQAPAAPQQSALATLLARVGASLAPGRIGLS